MRKVWIAFPVLAVIPSCLCFLPLAHRLYAQLLGIPLLWGLVFHGILPAGKPLALLGERKFWPFVWIPGLFFLSMGFLGVGYFNSLVIFSYGATRLQAVRPILPLMFIALTIVLTFGVELPLRKTLLKEKLLNHGVSLPAAMGLVAGLGMLRSVPFYCTGCLDGRYFFFALLDLFVRECTLSRLFLVTENLLACGVYHAWLVLVEAFLLSDVLGPYLPSFHWVSSSAGFYWLMLGFGSLPFLGLSLIKPTLAMRGAIK